MIKSRMVLLDIFLVFLYQILQIMNQILSHPHLIYIYLRLFLCQFLLTYFLTQLIQSPKIFLYQFFVFLILQPLVSRKGGIGVEIWVTNLIDDIFASSVQRTAELVFDQIEICVDSLLQNSAFRFNTTIHGIFFDQPHHILLIQKHSRPHMIMILFNTVLTTRRLLPYTTFWSTKCCYLLPVLTFVHFIYFLLLNINYHVLELVTELELCKLRRFIWFNRGMFLGMELGCKNAKLNHHFFPFKNFIRIADMLSRPVYDLFASSATC